MPDFSVDVSPEMEMYRVLQVQRYIQSRAIAEFIDNSLQSYLENQDKLSAAYNAPPDKLNEIKVLTYSSSYQNAKKRRSIIISDNAGGISRADFQRAIKPAAVNQARASNSLGEFGIGMKSAAVWFTSNWEISTTTLGKREELYLHFNLEQLIKQNKITADVKASSSAEKEKSGTTITLNQSDRHVETTADAQKLLKELQEIFVLFIRNNLINIRVYHDDAEIPIDTDSHIEVPETLKAPKYQRSGSQKSGLKYEPVGKDITWRKEIKFVVNNKPVNGYVILREKGSYVQNPGIRLFKNNRLIQGDNASPFLPVQIFNTGNKFGRQRIYGELHLDRFQPDYSKAEFIDKDIPQFLKQLEKKLSNGKFDLLEQTENYRSKGAKKKSAGKASASRKKTPTIIEKFLSELIDKTTDRQLIPLIKEMLCIAKKTKNSCQCPILLACGFRSILEKSLFHAAKNRTKIYSPSKTQTPSLNELLIAIDKKIADKKNDIFPKEYNKNYQMIKHNLWEKYLNMSAHNSYVPLPEVNDNFVTNFGDFILSLYD